MSIMRSVLLAGAENVWLREKAMRLPFVRRSTARFMPGETMDEALDACRRQQGQHGTGTILTHLGENLSSLAEADEVTKHYLDLLDRIAAQKLDTQVSVKLTQLGLDLGVDACGRHLAVLVERAEARGNMIWIDMESTKYVDPTLDVVPARAAPAIAEGRPVPAGLPASDQGRPRLAPPARARRSGSSRAPTGNRPSWPSPTRPRWTRATTSWPAECCSPTRPPGRSSVSALTTSG